MPGFTGYLTHTKTMLVEAMKRTFDQEYPEPDFRSARVSIEYPVEPQHYPGIWVDYEDTAPLQIAGINHRETTDGNTDGVVRPFTRWKFSGYASFTVVALTSLERDRLFDEVVRVLAFGLEAPQIQEFRTYIENNEYVAVNFDFDQIEVRGNAASPGTPWGTDEFIYERTINMEMIGEFVSEVSTGTLVPLSRIDVTANVVSDVDPSYQSPLPSEDLAQGWE